MGSFAAQVDVRKYLPKDRQKVIFQTIEGLGSGETMELVNDNNPLPLYYELTVGHKDKYDWEYLEQGPEVWRVAITRR